MYQEVRGYKLPLWIGMAQARAKGFLPIKGSKGAYILRPQKVSFPDLDANGIHKKMKMDLLKWFNLLSTKL